MPHSDDSDLLGFLYQSPHGVARVGNTGDVDKMNPAGCSKLIELGHMDAITNLFSLFERQAPEIIEKIEETDGETGSIYTEKVVEINPPGRPATWLSFRISRTSKEFLIIGFTDVTETMLQSQQLAVSAARMRAIFNSVREHAIFTLDLDGRIDSWNRSGERMFGYDADVCGSPLTRLMQHLDGSGLPDLADKLAVARDKERAIVTHRGLRQDGSEFWAETVVSSHRSKSKQIPLFYSVVVRDISHHVKREERLSSMAFTDALTGLTNRRRFDEVAEDIVGRALEAEDDASVIFIDADHFKSVNDTYGHETGDVVLQQIAGALKSGVRSVDVPARYGGEEFVVLLPETSQQGALVVAERLRVAIENLEIAHEGKIVSVTASLGVCSTADPGVSDLQALLEQADAALFTAKDNGRNQVVGADEL